MALPGTAAEDIQPEVVFVQPGYAHYRQDLFSRLAARLSVRILYVSGANEYPGAVAPGNFPHTFVARRTGLASIDTFLALERLNPRQVITSVSNAPHTLAAWSWCRLRRKPLTLWIEEWIEPRPDSSGWLRYLARRLKRRIGNLVIRTADHVVASGTAARSFALRIGAREKTTLHTIQCSEDLAATWPRNTSSPLHAPPRFLFMSRHIPSKGLDVLLEAFARVQRDHHPDATLVVGGDGPCRQAWEALAQRLQLRNTRFLGAVSPEDVGRLFADASVFILPSCVRENTGEPWGLVINEATSMSLPVIVTRTVGAGYDLVEEGRNGFVVPENDVERLAEAINRMFDADLQRMGRESRRLFDEKNRLDHMVDTFVQAIDQNRER